MVSKKIDSIIDISMKSVKDALNFMNLDDSDILKVMNDIAGKTDNTCIEEIVNQVLKYYYDLISNQVKNNDFTNVNMFINYILAVKSDIIGKVNLLGEFFCNIKVGSIEVFKEIINQNKELNDLLKQVILDFGEGLYGIFHDFYTILLIESYCIRNDINFVKEKDSDINSLKSKLPETISIYMQEIVKVPCILPDRERELFIQYKEYGDISARNKIIESNLRLVVFVAKSYFSTGIHPLDIISAGNIGLIKAVDSYDLSYDCKLSTLAYLSIAQSISTFCYNNNKIPRDYLVKRANYLNNSSKTLSYKEMADAFGTPVKSVMAYESMIQPSVSIYSNISDDSDIELADVLSDDSICVEESAIDSVINGEVMQILDGLDDINKYTLLLRFGLYDGIERSLEQVAKKLYKLGITKKIFSRERIRTIEDHALKKLRETEYVRSLKTFYKI